MPLQGDTLKFQGGMLEYMYLGSSWNGDKFVQRTKLWRNGDNYNTEVTRERVGLTVWQDLVRMACTIEEGKE
jgi:hypothetical protein